MDVSQQECLLWLLPNLIRHLVVMPDVLHYQGLPQLHSTRI